MNDTFIYHVRKDLCGCEWNNLGDRLKTCAGHATPQDFGAEPAPLQVAHRSYEVAGVDLADKDYSYIPGRFTSMLGNVLLALIGAALVVLGFIAGKLDWM